MKHYLVFGLLLLFTESLLAQDKAGTNIRNCDQSPGTTAGAKIAACILDLQSTGGIADARSFEGGQIIAQNLFDGVVKPVTLLTGCATYTYSVKQTIPSNVAILDYGRCTTFIQAASTNLMTSFEVNRNATNVHLEGFTLDGNSGNNTGPGQSYLVSFLKGTTDSLVRNVTLQNFYGLTGFTGPCLSVAGGTNVLIEGNTIRNCGGAGHPSDGIYTDGTRNRIIGNYIASCSDTAIVAEASADPLISNNTIVGCPQGIGVDSAIVQSTGTGAIISGNVMTDCGPASNGGIIWVFKGGGRTESRVVISNNIIKSTKNSRGILVDAVDYIDITGNVVTDTTFLDGIRVYNSDNVTITGNTSDLNDEIGFYIDSVSNAVIAGNTANDNSTANIGRNSGFYVHNGSNILISGNQAHDTRAIRRQVRGLIVDGTATQVFVTGNDFRFNRTDPGYLNLSPGNVRLGYNLTSSEANADEIIDYVRIGGELELENGKKIVLKGSGSPVDPYVVVTKDELQMHTPTGGVRVMDNAGAKTSMFISDTGSVQIGGNSGSSGGGIQPDGGGLKHIRGRSCVTAASTGSTCDTTITWTTPFADVSYTAVCSISDTSSQVRIVSIPTKTAQGIIVRIESLSAAASGGELNCIAIHD